MFDNTIWHETDSSKPPILTLSGFGGGNVGGKAKIPKMIDEYCSECEGQLDEYRYCSECDYYHG